MNRSENINELAAALAKARPKFKEIAKDKTAIVKGTSKNGSQYEYSYNYASLPNILAAVTEPLAEQGLTLASGVVNDGKDLETVLMHSSGQSISTIYPIIPKDGTMQGYGGGHTYSRRYAINGLLNISSEEDDDGQSVPTKDRIKAEDDDGDQPASIKEVGLVYSKSLEIRGMGKEEVDARLEKSFGVKSARFLNKRQFAKVMESLEKDK